MTFEQRYEWLGENVGKMCLRHRKQHFKWSWAKIGEDWRTENLEAVSRLTNRGEDYEFYPKSKAMAPHSSTLAWKIPRTEEAGGLQSTGSRRVGHDWVTCLSVFTLMHWRRKWQPTPASLPGESQGRGRVVGCCLWGHTESDTTEVT